MIPITIKLYKSEILYEIRNKSYLVGLNRPGMSVEQSAEILVNENEEHENQILRSVRSAYDLLLVCFDRYVSNYSKENDNVQAPNEATEKILIIQLSMPSNFNGAMSKTITSACHNYIVNSALGEWFALTAPGEAMQYATKAGLNLKEIEESMYKRKIPVRAKYR